MPKKPTTDKRPVTEVRRGSIIKPTTFQRKSGEVVRDAFVVIQFANGVDERIPLDGEVEFVAKEEKE